MSVIFIYFFRVHFQTNVIYYDKSKCLICKIWKTCSLKEYCCVLIICFCLQFVMQFVYNLYYHCILNYKNELYRFYIYLPCFYNRYLKFDLKNALQLYCITRTWVYILYTFPISNTLQNYICRSYRILMIKQKSYKM